MVILKRFDLIRSHLQPSSDSLKCFAARFFSFAALDAGDGLGGNWTEIALAKTAEYSEPAQRCAERAVLFTAFGLDSASILGIDFVEDGVAGRFKFAQANGLAKVGDAQH